MAKKVKKTRLQKLKPVFQSVLATLAVVYVAFLAYSYKDQIRFEIVPKAEEVKAPVTVEDVAPKVENTTVVVNCTVDKPRKPKYWFYMARQYMWIFFSVDNVLRRLGLEKINVEIKHGEPVTLDWDLLWSYDYHNEIPLDFKSVKYHQRINHIPGNYVLTMKDHLAVNTDSKYIPKAFNDTEKLKEYAAKNPGKRYLQKLWSNRGISLRKVEEMNFKVFGPGYKYFGQEYVEDPLLISGRKFDFGVYVLISSVKPLRIYIYEKNVLIRLCAENYDKNNYTNVDTYVISDACSFPWEIDELSVYLNQSYTYKEAMNAYFTKRGYDVSRIWTQVEDCIREIVVSKEDNFRYWLQRYAFKHTFFELYRFDFILNNNLDLFLIEINQSPNVNPSALLSRDQKLFENLLYNTFTLIGVGHYMPKEDFRFGNIEVEAMVAHEESWTVLPETCINRPCNETCNADEICYLCLKCMDNNKRHELHLAYREAKNRGAMKRIFPTPAKEILNMEYYLNTLNFENRWLTRWYIEMCKKDADFC